jgi:hypothetical protein
MMVSHITSTDHGYTTQREVTLRCVYDQDTPEDQRFQKATPSGEIKMQIDNPAALAQFTVGHAFYVDFTPVPAAAPAEHVAKQDAAAPEGVTTAGSAEG